MHLCSDCIKEWHPALESRYSRVLGRSLGHVLGLRSGGRILLKVCEIEKVVAIGPNINTPEQTTAVAQ